MDEILNDKKSIKKFIVNTVNSTINKKTNSFKLQLDEILEKLNILLHEKNNTKLGESKLGESKLGESKLGESKLGESKLGESKLGESKLGESKLDESKLDDVVQEEEEEEEKPIKEVKRKKVIKKEIIEKDNNLNNLNNLVNPINYFREIKIEHFDIDKNIILDCLHMNNVSGDVNLFKKMYLDNVLKEYYPIRHIKNKYQYWLDDKMIDDNTSAEYIKNTIIKNIEFCYRKVNIFDNYNDNIDQFIKNQEHINKFNEIKYKDKIFASILPLIEI
jgi:uncharacterized low-complexity protein